MAPHLMDILSHMWNTLTQNADHYVRTVVNYTDDADDLVDSDGKKHNYFKLSGIWHCMVKLWMAIYSFSLLCVFTRTKVGPGVGCQMLVKLLLSLLVLPMKQRYYTQKNSQLKVLWTQLCTA